MLGRALCWLGFHDNLIEVWPYGDDGGIRIGYELKKAVKRVPCLRCGK